MAAPLFAIGLLARAGGMAIGALARGAARGAASSGSSAKKINVSHDLARLTRDLTRFQRQVIPNATQMALNKVAASVRAEAVRELAKVTGLRQKDTRAATTLRKAHKGKPFAEIVARGRPLNLIRFDARQLKKGVSARPWGKRWLFKPRVFIANQGRTVFIRERGAGRLPIRGMFGPSIARELLRDEVMAAINRKFAERWPIEFERALNVQFRKLIGRR
jgi:hypothetical protein